MNQPVSGNDVSQRVLRSWNFSLDKALLPGHGSIILQWIFGIKLSWIAYYDCAAGANEIINPVPNEKYQGIAKLLPDLVQEYYRLFVGTARDSQKCNTTQ